VADPVRYATILEGLEVLMGLGIHAEELAAPQRVILSVRMEVDYPAAPRDDRIEEVLDYDFLRDGIRAMTAERHFHLQETLCEAVAALCLADARVARVTVRSSKPDIYPDAAVGCEIVRGKGNRPAA
jgi:dihydroneopterin aldolase